MASIMIMNVAAYFPEYLRAKIAAGFMFSLILQRPKIDNLSERGLKIVKFCYFLLYEI